MRYGKLILRYYTCYINNNKGHRDLFKLIHSRENPPEIKKSSSWW